jgi:hypothetical protein
VPPLPALVIDEPPFRSFVATLFFSNGDAAWAIRCAAHAARYRCIAFDPYLEAPLLLADQTRLLILNPFQGHIDHLTGYRLSVSVDALPLADGDTAPGLITRAGVLARGDDTPGAIDLIGFYLDRVIPTIPALTRDTDHPPPADGWLLFQGGERIPGSVRLGIAPDASAFRLEMPPTPDRPRQQIFLLAEHIDRPVPAVHLTAPDLDWLGLDRPVLTDAPFAPPRARKTIEPSLLAWALSTLAAGARPAEELRQEMPDSHWVDLPEWSDVIPRYREQALLFRAALESQGFSRDDFRLPLPVAKSVQRPYAVAALTSP